MVQRRPLAHELQLWKTQEEALPCHSLPFAASLVAGLETLHDGYEGRRTPGNGSGLKSPKYL